MSSLESSLTLKYGICRSSFEEKVGEKKELGGTLVCVFGVLF